MIRVSVIVPVYKAERYIGHCIESIIAQTYPNWELLLIDDGSPDKSGKICDKYAIADSRIKVFHKTNGGVSSARNYALEQDLGDWVMFVDADDAIAPQTIELCLEKIFSGKLDLLQFGFTNSEEYGTYDERETLPLNAANYVQENKYLVCVGGSIIRSTLFKDNHLRFNEELKLAEDQLVMMECIRLSRRMQKINNRFYYYRLNPNSAIHNSKTSDMIISALALTHYRDMNMMFSRKINKVLLLFIIDIIRNNDLPVNDIVKLYDNLNINDCTLALKSGKLFYYIARISTYMATIIIKKTLK